MRVFQAVGTLTLCVLAAAIPAVFAGDDQDNKKDKQEHSSKGKSTGKAQGKSAQNKGKSNAKQEQRDPNEKHRSQEEARAWQQKRGWAVKDAWPARDNWQATRAQRWSVDHRTWTQRGGYGGFYIPQETFRLHFGKENRFRITSRPAIHLGYPRFEYGGFSFLMVDPWPEYWAENWYEYDDVFVDYDDGYYLHNRSYAQVRIAITIVL